ncbi:zinc finger protein 541 isoform X2 [Lissotriton helveticus]
MFSLSDFKTVPKEMHLSTLQESQGHFSSCDLCSGSCNGSGKELPGPNLDPGLQIGEMIGDDMEENFGRLSQSGISKEGGARTPEASSDRNLMPSLQELELVASIPFGEQDLVGNPNLDGTRRGRRHRGSPQSSLQECSLCGKTFSSASSLSKHYVTHSQERKHVCKICTKAFKRQDHLTGHMLTHQKTKPFICGEQGCKKSYCDYRSLRRHYEVQHSICTPKELCSDEGACCESPQPCLEAPHMDSLGVPRTLDNPPSRPKSPNTTAPNQELLRCLVSSIVTQTLPQSMVFTGRQCDGSTKVSLQPCILTPKQSSCGPEKSRLPLESGGTETLKEYENNIASSSTYTLINSSNLSTATPSNYSKENAPLKGKDLIPLTSQFFQQSEGLDCRPSTALPCFQVFRSSKITADSQLPSQNYPWMRDILAHCKNKISSTCTASDHSMPCTEISEDALPTSDTFAHSYSDPPSISTTLIGVGDEKVSFNEETLKDKHESPPLQYLGEQWHPDTPNQSQTHSEDGPLFQQLYLKCPEPRLSQEQLQIQKHLFHMITSSQHILSHSQIAAQSQLTLSSAKYTLPKPPHNVLHQPEEVQQLPNCMRFDVSPRNFRTLTTLCKDFSPTSVKLEQADLEQVSSSSRNESGMNSGALDGSMAFSESYAELEDIFSMDGIQPSKALPEDLPERQLCVQSNQQGNSFDESSHNEKTQEIVAKSMSNGGRPRRSSSSRKEKLKFSLCCNASPSQVAMASFSNSETSEDKNSKLAIFNRIQSGRNYNLPNSVTEETFLEGCSMANGGTTDWEECQSNSYICKNCSQLFCTEKGLNSHICFYNKQWQSPPKGLDQQLCSADSLSTQSVQMLQESELISPGSIKPLENPLVAPLLMPVSVPVTETNAEKENKVFDREILPEKSSKESTRNKRKKKRPRPKALFIPPPMPLADEVLPLPESSGCFQSHLRSPSVFLGDYLLGNLLHCHPYTPPPMLSPIREGSGLYFNTICPPSVKTGPCRLYSHLLGKSIGSSGKLFVKDDTIFSVEPHINVGSRFQAEIPPLQDRTLVECDKHPAFLVWKPWGNVETNQDTQDGVSQLLNVSCSSVMPGGGTNVELALHCLHATQGSILDALEMLLVKEPWKPPSHPLAQYHYTGSDFWTPSEKRLFKKGFCAHKKDFHMIQNMIQTKNVTQCVEYYYTWKKIIKFDQSRSQAAEKKVKIEQSELEAVGPKIMDSNGQHQEENEKLMLKQRKLEKKSLPGAKPEVPPTPGAFTCKECERVFDKIKSRNAHMKRHRQQEHIERLAKKWPAKSVKVEPKERGIDEAIPLNLCTTDCEVQERHVC